MGVNFGRDWMIQGCPNSLGLFLSFLFLSDYGVLAFPAVCAVTARQWEGVCSSGVWPIGDRNFAPPRGLYLAWGEGDFHLSPSLVKTLRGCGIRLACICPDAQTWSPPTKSSDIVCYFIVMQFDTEANSYNTGQWSPPGRYGFLPTEVFQSGTLNHLVRPPVNSHKLLHTHRHFPP